MIAALVLVAIVAALTLHTAVNIGRLRRPGSGSTVDATVAVLVPARDEADRIEACLRALLALDGQPPVMVLDDGSTDATAAIARALGVTVVTGEPLPPGWLGKPYACHQLARLSTADVLVFVDADVVLEPAAVTEAVRLLEGVDLVSPYARIIANGAQRLVQPLLQWSWLTFLPLRAMERSRRPALAAAGGQFLVVRRAAYERAGGHAAVRAAVLEDVELARAVKRSGGRIALADGSRLATCRMYGSWRELRDGYTKSLWAAFGSPVGAAVVTGLLLGLYVVPVALAVAAAAAGAWAIAGAATAAYGLGVLGRLLTARATGGRGWPDALAHPVSIVAFGWLLLRSYARRGRVRWKGRPV